MELKNLLLHLDPHPGSLRRLDLAIDLARVHRAHLQGLYPVPRPFYFSRHEAVDETIRRTEETFLRRCGEAGISAEWIAVNGEMVGVKTSDILCRHACYSDLVIVGQPAPGADLSLDFPERLGLRAGCPLLVVPAAGLFRASATTALVAWKPGREAARSIRDALPLLRTAEQVSVVTIDSDGHSDPDSARRICATLARHQIQAEHELVFAGSDSTVGDLLLNQACEQRVDLLVMGAYAPSRGGKVVLSPVARHILTYLTVPVFISF